MSEDRYRIAVSGTAAEALDLDERAMLDTLGLEEVDVRRVGVGRTYILEGPREAVEALGGMAYDRGYNARNRDQPSSWGAACRKVVADVDRVLSLGPMEAM